MLLFSSYLNRASHDSEYRKLKTETKKLLEVIGNVKKAAANESAKHTTDIAKLMEEIATLKDSRNLLEKKLRNCTCTSAVKVVKNSTLVSNDAKVDQIMASAKAEIQRLVSHERAWFSIEFLIGDCTLIESRLIFMRNYLKKL